MAASSGGGDRRARERDAVAPAERAVGAWPHRLGLLERASRLEDHVSQLDSVDETQKPETEQRVEEEKAEMEDVEEGMETDAEQEHVGSGGSCSSKEEREDAEGQEESPSQARSPTPCSA